MIKKKSYNRLIIRKYQRTRQLSDDVNKEINEIFDEYEDEEFDGSYKKTLH
jgi:hypothetical protein